MLRGVRLMDSAQVIREIRTNPLVCLLAEFETLQMPAPTGDPECLTAERPEQDTNEVMTEEVETPQTNEVTDEPVLPDSETEDKLIIEREMESNHCPPIRTRRPPNVLCYDQLGNPQVITLAMHRVFKYQQPILFLVNSFTIHLVHRR